MKSCRHKRHDGILSPQGEEEGRERWDRARGFLNCGSKFSHVGASFQLALAFDKMKSCRHKRYRHLILSWFRAGGSDLIGRRRGIQRQGATDRQKSLWIENAARPRNLTVSPDRVHPTRAEMYPPILLRRLCQRAVSANGKKVTKTAKAGIAGCQHTACPTARGGRECAALGQNGRFASENRFMADRA